MASIREERKAKIKDVLERANAAYKEQDYPTALKLLMPYRSDKKVQHAIRAIERASGKAGAKSKSQSSVVGNYLNAIGISLIAVCGLMFFMGAFYKPSSSPRTNETEREMSSSTTVASTPIAAQVYYSNIAGAYVRSCTEGNCEVLAALPAGEEVDFIAFAEGAEISGSTLWYQVLLNDGREGFIHSTVVSEVHPTPAPTRRPSTAVPSTNLGGNTTSSTGNNSSERPGNCSTAVAMELSAQQAAEWNHLDRDDDGVACYGD